MSKLNEDSPGNKKTKVAWIPIERTPLPLRGLGLMQKLLTGEVRVKVNDKCDPAEDNS